MSIDFFYSTKDGGATKEFLEEEFSNDYDILPIKTNEDGVVTYFSVQPKDLTQIIYKEKGYEFHLQNDGLYWHTILTRDDDEFDVENEVLTDISISLDFDQEWK